MAKIIFIQTTNQELNAMFYLCGALKQFGHEYSILISNNANNIIEGIRESKVDLIGFSINCGNYMHSLNIIKGIRKSLKTPIIIGGPQPTFFPDIIHEYGVDIVCRGEGEFPLVDLMNRIDEGAKYNNTENLWIKQDNKRIIKNDIRNLVDPLDLIPMPDYSVYKDYPIIMNHLQPFSYVIRGCPYSCSYCGNNKYRLLYKGKGKVVRCFSPDRIIAELTESLRVFPDAKHVTLAADCFTADEGWIEELMTKYKEKIRIPFSCSYRPEMINEKKISLLKEGGCHYIAIGIESGSERIRRDLLNRFYSNEDVIRMAAILKKYNIEFRTYNMIGLPRETEADIWQTIDLNRKIRPELPWCSIYIPYPGTDLCQLAVEDNLLPSNFDAKSLPSSYHFGSVLNLANKNYVINAHHLFQSAVLFPELMKPFLKIIMNLPANKLIELWFKAVFLYCKIKADKPTSLLRYIYSMIISRN